jgi:putative transposase
MPNYRRAFTPGGTFFFTVVTYRRHPVLTHPDMVSALRGAVRDTRAALPFIVVAAVVLPDHLHTIWELPEADADFSVRWSRIKQAVTHVYAGLPIAQVAPTASRVKRREGALWQRRFWEHRIRDDADLVRHVEYIHYNPVKHGHAARVGDWPHSSFHAYVRNGVYTADWGGGGFVEGGEGFGE